MKRAIRETMFSYLREQKGRGVTDFHSGLMREFDLPPIRATQVISEWTERLPPKVSPRSMPRGRHPRKLHPWAMPDKALCATE